MIVMSQEVHRKGIGEELRNEGEEEVMPIIQPTVSPPDKPSEGPQAGAKERVKLPEEYLVSISAPLYEVEIMKLYEINTTIPSASSFIIVPEIPFSAIKPMRLKDLTLKTVIEEPPLPFDIHELIDMIIGAWPQFEELSTIEMMDMVLALPEPLDTPSRVMKLIEEKLRIRFIRRLFKKPRPFIRIGRLVQQVPKAKTVIRAKSGHKGPEEAKMTEQPAEVRPMRVPRPQAWEVELMGGVLEEALSMKVEGKRIGLSILVDRPCVILAKKPVRKRYEYIEFLKPLLRELYRVRIGGLPSPRHITTRGFERESLRVKAGRRIYLIDVDEVLKLSKEKGSEEAVKENEFQDYIADRLRELFSQGYGFLVFYGYEAGLRIVRGVLTEIAIPLEPIEIRIVEGEAVFNIASLVWGSVRPEWPEPMPELTLDAYAVRREHEFYDTLYRIANNLTAALLVKPSPEPEERIGKPREGESLTHYAIKAFVVKYFMEREKVPADNIKTEHKLDSVIVDVLVSYPTRGRIIVEVETLYGTGLPLTKLVETIESRVGLAEELWIVIPNPQAMLFLNHIIALREYCKKQGLPVEFYTLDIEDGELKPITELKRIADGILKSIQKTRRKELE